MEPGVIRPATVADLPALLEMGRAFWEEAGHAEQHAFCEESFSKTLAILGNAGLLLVLDNGSIIGMAAADVAPCIVNHAVKIGREAFFYVRPKQRKGMGRLLIKALEDVSIRHGATVFDLVAERGSPRSGPKFTRGEALGRLYQAHGYALAESTYRRVL